MLQEKVDGASGGDLVQHHPGSRISGWTAGGIDETISAHHLLSALRVFSTSLADGVAPPPAQMLSMAQPAKPKADHGCGAADH